MSHRPGLVYLDTSAVVKLIIPESGTGALEQFLANASRERVSSALLRVELLCVCRRRHIPVADALAILSGVNMFPLTNAILERASGPYEPSQRALDAIHLASAQAIGDHLDVFVSYDDAQRQAARALGWDAQAPV